MASNIIGTVIEKEKIAAEETEAAKMKAEELLNTEKKKARDKYEEICRDAENETALLRKKTGEEIEAAGLTFREKYMKEIEEILLKAGTKKEDAIKKVIDKIFYQQ